MYFFILFFCNSLVLELTESLVYIFVGIFNIIPSAPIITGTMIVLR